MNPTIIYQVKGEAAIEKLGPLLAVLRDASDTLEGRHMGGAKKLATKRRDQDVYTQGKKRSRKNVT